VGPLWCASKTLKFLLTSGPIRLCILGHTFCSFFGLSKPLVRGMSPDSIIGGKKTHLRWRKTILLQFTIGISRKYLSVPCHMYICHLKLPKDQPKKRRPTRCYVQTLRQLAFCNLRQRTKPPSTWEPLGILPKTPPTNASTVAYFR